MSQSKSGRCIQKPIRLAECYEEDDILWEDDLDEEGIMSEESDQENSENERSEESEENEKSESDQEHENDTDGEKSEKGSESDSATDTDNNNKPSTVLNSKKDSKRTKTVLSNSSSKRRKSEKQVQIELLKITEFIEDLPETHFLQQHQFREKITIFSPPQFSNSSFGPRNIPTVFLNEKDSMIFFYDHLWDHILEKTNQRMREKNIRYSSTNEVLQIDKVTLINYWCLFWAMGIIRLSNRQWYWNFWENTQGLIGNDFFKSTMGYRLWSTIDRCIQANLKIISTMITEHNKQNWIPFPNVCFDDDLDLWKGKGGRKKHLNKKADGTGQANWKIVDEKKYCYFIFYEVDLDTSSINIPVGEYYFQILLQQLPNEPYCCVIDAGILGSWENVIRLTEQHKYFIVSCKKDRPSPLWTFLQKDIKLYQWKWISNSSCVALSYYAKKCQSEKKIVNLLFNKNYSTHCGTNNHSKSRYQKSTKSFIDVTCPEVIWDYNATHNYVDGLKNILSRSRNVL